MNPFDERWQAVSGGSRIWIEFGETISIAIPSSEPIDIVRSLRSVFSDAEAVCRNIVPVCRSQPLTPAGPTQSRCIEFLLAGRASIALMRDAIQDGRTVKAFFDRFRLQLLFRV